MDVAFRSSPPSTQADKREARTTAEPGPLPLISVTPAQAGAHGRCFHYRSYPPPTWGERPLRTAKQREGSASRFPRFPQRPNLTQVMAHPAAIRHAANAMSTIPLQLCEDAPAPSIQVDAIQVARALGLDVAAFRQLMDTRKVSVLCERGTGEDTGRWRATFYHAGRRARLVVDAHGNVLAES